MSFYLLYFNKLDNSINNKTVEEKATQLIKELSGQGYKRKKRIIDNVVMFTGSGGAGASTIASNVAYAASKKDMHVLVIDLNYCYPSQHFAFKKKSNGNAIASKLFDTELNEMD